MEMGYSDCLKTITPDELYKGLLAYGLFTEKLPPIFTSKPFFDYCQNDSTKLPDKVISTYIYYESIRNSNAPRALGVPNPFAYQKLCKCLADNWDKLQEHFSSNTCDNEHKISRIHLRKLKDNNALFEMNYKNYKIDGNPEPDLLIGAKYMVCADISNCFPSMYSHAISWALVGQDIAKLNQKNHNEWYNQIDFHSRNTKDGETQGLLIGPHASNLLSEIILTSIDEKLHTKSWKYIRHIDDYTCFVENYKQANEFIIDLIEELRKYGLILNHKKTEIKPLPVATVERWVRKLNTFIILEQMEYIKFNEVRAYLDLAIELVQNNKENTAIINYAIKVIAKRKLTDNARRYFIKTVFHLAIIYPYLIQLLEEYIFDNFNVSKDSIQNLSQRIFNIGMGTKNYEATSYAVYFALKYNFKLQGNTYESAEKSNNCIYMLFGYLYDKKFNSNDLKKYRDLAKCLNSNKRTASCFWLFIYEVLSYGNLKDYWKPMKKEGVTFLKSI